MSNGNLYVAPDPSPGLPPLERARRKAYWRLLPLLFLCYVIAYVDRNNVGLAKLTMGQDLGPAFNDGVFGLGIGMFFIGYFLLEIPGTLLVETWSARKWICRIMVTWGIVAALTSLVRTPGQFYLARFFLGLAEAGFYPGVIIYLTHWFPERDRTRAFAWFMVATPVAQFIQPKLSYPILRIGTTEEINGVLHTYPQVLGMAGWQWMFIVWGLPAVVLGIMVLFWLTDRPHEAKWLDPEEREALEAELAKERERVLPGSHLSWLSALKEPRVLWLALAYFCVVSANYSVETFLPSIIKSWSGFDLDKVTWLLLLPALGSLFGQLYIGWSSDRTGERRLHTCLPIYIAAVGLGLTTVVQGNLPAAIGMFIIAATGLKAYLPAFWALPSLFLVATAKASSVGLINSVGNLGGFVGPVLLGYLKERTGSYAPGLIYGAISMVVSATIILFLGLGRRAAAPVERELGPAALKPAIAGEEA